MDKHKGPITNIVLDEIALEGLEGVTIKDFWTRLSIALNLELPLLESFQNQIWGFIVRSTMVSFYELPDPRRKYDTPDRRMFFNNDTDILEDEDSPEYLFNFIPIQSGEIRGSCELYKKRKEIPLTELKDLSLKKIDERWGEKLIMVGSQELREKSLFPPNMEKPRLALLHHCVLEVIARFRYSGILTGGKNSILKVLKDSGLLFYVTNLLLQMNLIKKQSITGKINGRIWIGHILHLTRFSVEIPKKNLNILKYIYDGIKSSENEIATLLDIKKVMPPEIHKSFKRFQSSDMFRRYFVKEKVPYRKMYPNATLNQWKLKRSDNEKVVVVIRLLDPDTTFDDIKSRENNSKDDNTEQDQRYLDVRNQYLDMPILDQIYRTIEKFGSVGCTATEIINYLGIHRYHVRKVLKTLRSSKYISAFLKDFGRQRTWVYITNKNANANPDKTFVPNAKDLIESLRCNTASSHQSVEETKEEISQTLLCDNEKSVEESLGNEEVRYIITSVEENTENTNEKSSPSVQSQIINTNEKVVRCSDVIPLSVISEYEGTNTNFPSMKVKIMQVSRRSNAELKSPLTSKQISRTNMIVDTVKEQLVVEMVQMFRIIKSQESDLGYTDKLCKKSLVRAVNWLTAHKIINYFEVVFQLKEYAKVEKFLCHNNVTTSHPLLNEEIKRIGDSFYMYVSERFFLSKMAEKMKTQERESPSRTNIQTRVNYCKKCPRFLRARKFHELLFYLACEQEKSAEPIKLNEYILMNWAELYPSIDVEKIKEIIPPLYSENVDFKMFIPPLPNYEYGNGWNYAEDIWYRVPLSLVAQMFKIELKDKEQLENYLTHPILQHIPISLLPIDVQGPLAFSKILSGNVYEDILKVLNLMGLIQVSFKQVQNPNPRKSWIYLNRHTSLLQTSNSDEGYDQISEDKEYEEIRFTFQTHFDVQSYWNALYQICLMTKLGHKAHPSQKKHAREIPDLKPVEFSKAIENDRGHLPGDKLGAAGLDSSLYVHITKNWSLSTVKEDRKMPLNLDQVGFKVSTKSRNVKIRRRTPNANTKKRSKLILLTNKKIVSKKINKRRKSRLVYRYYDQTDMEALKRMQKLRTTWTPEEDAMLLSCRAVLIYWKHPFLHRVINAFTIRDIIHWSSGSLSNKTSIACQRRMVNLIKTKKAQSDVSTWVFELKRSKFINQRFGQDFLRDLRKVYSDDLEYGTALRVYFIQMVYYLRKIVKSGAIISDNQCIMLPSSVNLFKKYYRESPPAMNTPQLKYFEPKTIEEVELSTINLVIHSSMCCLKDKTLLNVQLFDIYKEYKEETLSKAFKQARDDQLISHQKRKTVSSASSFCLSHKYKIQLFLTVPYNCLDEFYQVLCSTFSKLFDETVEPKQRVAEFSSVNSGGLLYLADLINRENINIEIEFPKKVLTIDPNQSSAGESEKILDHFRKLFENAPKHDYSKIIDVSECREESSQPKIKFGFTDDTYLLSYNPYDIVAKLRDEYLHFFCALGSLNKEVDFIGVESMLYVCPFSSCVLENENFIDAIEKIVKNNAETVNVLARNNETDELLEDKVRITTENLLQVFWKLQNILKLQANQNDKKDFGKTLGEKNVVDMMTLTKDLLKWNNDVEDISKSCVYEATLNKEEKIARLQDIFVVNIPKLRVTYNSETNNDITVHEGKKIPGHMKDLCSRFNGILANIRRDALWFTQSLDLEEEFKKKQFTSSEMQTTKSILQLIKDCPLGVTSTVLRNKYHNEILLVKCVRILRECNLIMRTGVTEWTFVYKDHVRPWIIYSYHIKRLEKESSVQQPNMEFMSDFTRKRKGKSDVDSEPEIKLLKTEELDSDVETSHEDIIDKVSQSSYSESSSRQRKRVLKPVKKYSDSDSKPKTNVLNKEIIMHRPHPWIRVNGSLNRRVLDKWLGTIFLECLTMYGLNVKKLFIRFNYLHPVHILYLLEILQVLNCISLKKIPKRKPSLFSSYVEVEEDYATEFSDLESVFVTVQPNAINNLTLFIGEKKYKTDFI